MNDFELTVPNLYLKNVTDAKIMECYTPTSKLTIVLFSGLKSMEHWV